MMRDTHVKKHNRPWPVLIAGILCLALGFGLGYVVFYTPKVTVKTVSETVDNKTLRQVYRILKNNYMDTSSGSLSDRMIKGMTNGLGDPHTSYMTKKEYEAFDNNLNGHYVGIGISYVNNKQGALITEVFPGGNAAKAGLKAGDVITAVDGVDLAGKSTQKMQDMIRGEAGSLVNFTYRHLGKTKNVHIKRKESQSAVSARIEKDHKVKYGYLRMSSFSDDSADYVKQALTRFQHAHVQALIIDLRNNGGGYVNAAEDILSMFNKKGTALYSTMDKSGKRSVVRDDTLQRFSFPHNYVLVNHNTASASEILAGSLRELDGFQMIGEKTYGKGTMQIEQPLSNGGVLKYTYAKWYSAKGQSINGRGWQPDVSVHSLNTNDLNLHMISKSYHRGDLNSYVKTMEMMLQSLHFKPGREDGYFSSKAKAALKAYQKKRKLTADGVYNKKTYEYLVYDYLQASVKENNDPVLNKVKSLMKEGRK